MKNKRYIPLILIGTGLLVISFVVWQKRQVILHAKKYLGILEKGENAGFNDPEFQQKLKNIGWKSGYQWCVFFVKAMWADVYPFLKKKTHNGKILLDYISGNSQTTYANFIKLANETNMFVVSAFPKPGDIVIWQNYDESGKPKETGHAALVTSVKGEKFKTIEGNVGNKIDKKEHDLGEFMKKTGSRLKGFIHYRNV